MLKSPFIIRIRLLACSSPEYPFNVKFMKPHSQDVDITSPIVILTGGNGAGKSTLLESIAEKIGFDQAGGAVGYKPVDHTGAIEKNGGQLSEFVKLHWLPKVGTGWFFRSETFFDVARYLDASAKSVGALPPNFLSRSHGEGFLNFFSDRVSRRGVYLLDEPESAVSPTNQKKLCAIIMSAAHSGTSQFIVATHSPIMMAMSGAQVLDVGEQGLREAHYRTSDAFIALRDFFLQEAADEYPL